MDAKPAPSVQPFGLMEKQRVRFVVELDPGEPLTGSAELEGRSPVRFEGMLGFLALFERLRQGEEPPGLPQED